MHLYAFPSKGQERESIKFFSFCISQSAVKGPHGTESENTARSLVNLSPALLYKAQS